MKVRLLTFLFIAVASRGHAGIVLPAVISDHMVIQAEVPAAIWGWADPGEKVTVAVAGQTKTATAAADGKWIVKLESLRASAEPGTLKVSGSAHPDSSLEVHDVLIGQVWLASGQSNMEMQIKGKQHGSVDHADEEIAAAKFPQIRMFRQDQPYTIYDVPAPPEKPLADRAGQWCVCSPETVAEFSALGYFFARELHQQLRVPVGIVTAAVGGTPIEAWTSLEAQKANPALQPVLADWEKHLTQFDPRREQTLFNEAKRAWLKQRSAALKAGQPAPKAPAPFKNLRVMTPGVLFNGVIAPLIPYTVRGVIWYQGERNAAGPLTGLYGAQLRTLIADWRARWGSEFYFAWVQLPGFKNEQRAPSEPNGWGVAVRDEMRRTLSVPRTGMAVTIDLGGVTAGHPTNKAAFAARLTPLVLHDVYEKPVAIWCGPLFHSAQRDGDRMVLAFDHSPGLKPSSGEIQGFAIAGSDQKFVWAKARITDDKVIVWSDSVKDPAAVRYGWASNPKANLVNAAGLPASPFRTDEWK